MDRVKWTVKYLVISVLAVLMLTVGLFEQKKNYEYSLRVKQDEIDVVNEEKTLLTERLEKANEDIAMLERDYEKVRVQFTNYYRGDSEGSTSKTGSGLSTGDFEINSKGWYTYQDKVVLAASTYECLLSDYGGCATVNTFKDVPKGYELYRYYDELVIEIDGIKYEAIVLDSCLASFWDRELQTYDIFIADEKYAFGKTKGVIYK